MITLNRWYSYRTYTRIFGSKRIILPKQIILPFLPEQKALPLHVSTFWLVAWGKGAFRAAGMSAKHLAVFAKNSRILLVAVKYDSLDSVAIRIGFADFLLDGRKRGSITFFDFVTRN